MSAAAAPGWTQDDKTLYSRASEAYWNEEYRRAENLYRQIVEKGRGHSLYWDARFGLAKALYKQEELIEARRHFAVVRNKHPDRGVRGDALFSQAEIAILLDNLSKARQLLKTFLEVYDNHVLYPNAKQQLKLLKQARPRTSGASSESTRPSPGTTSTAPAQPDTSTPMDQSSRSDRATGTVNQTLESRSVTSPESRVRSSDSPAESDASASYRIEPNLEPPTSGSSAGSSSATSPGSAGSSTPLIEPDINGSSPSADPSQSSGSPEVQQGRITIPDDPGMTPGPSAAGGTQARPDAGQSTSSGGDPLAGIVGTTTSARTQPSSERSTSESPGRRLIKPNLAESSSPVGDTSSGGAPATSQPDDVSFPVPGESQTAESVVSSPDTETDTDPHWNQLARRLKRLQEQQEELLRTNQRLRNMLSDLGGSPGGDTVAPAPLQPSAPAPAPEGPSGGTTAAPSPSPEPSPSTPSSRGVSPDTSVSELMEAGRYDRAWQRQQQKLQKNPSARQYHRAYRILRARGADSSTAYSYLRKAIEQRSPTPVEYLLDELEVLRELDRDDRLRRRLPRIKEAVQERGSATQKARYHYERGRLYMARGKPDQAFFEFMDSIQAREDSKWARQSRQIIRNEL